MDPLNPLIVGHINKERHEQARQRTLARQARPRRRFRLRLGQEGRAGRVDVPAASTLRQLMREVAQPVVVITGHDTDRRPQGMTVSSFTSVSLDPPLMLFCPARTSTTWAAIAPAGEFMLNVLTEGQTAHAAHFARPGPGLPPHALHEDPDEALPILAEAAFTARCTVHAVHPGGDHDVVVARVGAVQVRRPARPLTYWRGEYASVRPMELPCRP